MRSETLPATEAKARILALLDDVAAGGEIAITKHGRVVARLVPGTGPHARRGRFTRGRHGEFRRRRALQHRGALEPGVRLNEADESQLGYFTGVDRAPGRLSCSQGVEPEPALACDPSPTSMRLSPPQKARPSHPHGRPGAI